MGRSEQVKDKVKNKKADKCPFGGDVNSALDNFTGAWNKLVAELLKYHNGNTIQAAVSLTIAVSKHTEDTLAMFFGKEVK